MILWGLTLAAAVPNLPIAIGPEPSVAAATRAARACGMTNIRHDPLDDRRSMLLMGDSNTYAQVNCTLAWIKKHWREMHFEPIMVGNEAPEPEKLE